MYRDGFIVVALVAGLGGCQIFSPESTVQTPPTLPLPKSEPVQATDITEENAREKMRALQEEIENDGMGSGG